PWAVLAAWALQWPDGGVRVFTLARSDGVVTCAKGLRVLPDETWETALPLDVLVYPGGRGTRRELADEAVLDWVRGLSTGGTVVASVCTGSLVLAAAGLLDRKPAATLFVPGLTAELHPAVVERILEAGHEVGHHSFTHRSPVGLSEAEERRELERGFESLERFEVRPEGYRAPSWEPSWRTAALVAE